MPRPDPNAPGPGQGGLFEVQPKARDYRARHSAAVDKARAAGRSAELISDVDEAAATLLRAGAWSLDAFEAQNKPYGPSKLMQGMNEALRELHMTPESRGTDTEGDLAALAAQLGQIQVDDDDPAIPDTTA